MTLVEFLTARWDELEVLANSATSGPWEYDGNPSAVVVTADEGRSLAASAYNWSDPVCAANARHIATHDPTYVLADIAAKRAILELYADAEQKELPADAWVVMKSALAHLAIPFASHPDYDESWRPA